jgi:ADP-heptose:LPS heptosyltransferase
VTQILDSSSDLSRLLIIRFSSLGDIVHVAAVPKAFKLQFPKSKVDWLVRSDFAGLLAPHPSIDNVISFERKAGFNGLLALAWKMGATNYTHVYDAHSNVRSHFFSTVMGLRRFMRALTGTPRPKFIRRSKQRFNRWLLFRFRVNRFDWPFRSADSFQRPLARWGISPKVPDGQQFFPSGIVPQAVDDAVAKLKRPLIALAPSATYEMKRWPIEHFKRLIELMPHASFAILGGPDDSFTNEIAAAAPDRTLNLTGRLNFDESSSFLLRANAVVANDTGMMHIADQMEVPVIALIGPTAFGYPSHKTSMTAEIALWCKPCSKDGRGKCVNDLYKRCLIEITPERVVSMLEKLPSMGRQQ